jgi:hypothetical protein
MMDADEIKWTAHGNAKIRVDSLSARANLYQDSINRGLRPTNVGKYSMSSRYRRAFTQPTMNQMGHQEGIE